MNTFDIICSVDIPGQPGIREPWYYSTQANDKLEAAKRTQAVLKSLEMTGDVVTCELRVTPTIADLPQHVQDWIAAVEDAPLALEPDWNLPEFEDWVAPAAWSDVSSIVGCYSEAFFACSYNEDDVLALLVSGRMNAEAKSHLADSYHRDWFRNQMGKEYRRPDGDYEGPLMRAVLAAGGWPTSYGGQPAKLTPLVQRLFKSGLLRMADLT